MKKFNEQKLRWFASDNNASVHPRIMRGLQEANTGHAIGYGDDIYTREASEVFKDTFGSGSETFLVWNGTGANVMALAAALKPWEGVICTDIGHIATDETGAPERIAGIKIFTVSSDNGKLRPEGITETVSDLGWVHSNLPRMVSISQPTETGLVYSLDELEILADVCRKHNLLLHVDGARLSNAAVALKTGLNEAAGPADIISLGGTKNGLMFGEALVFRNPALTPGLGNLRKNILQLASKMRYLSAQYSIYLKEDLWRVNAEKSNKLAGLLNESVQSRLGLMPAFPVDTNAVFTHLEAAVIDKVSAQWFFYTLNRKEGLVRWMCSWDNTEEDVHAFVDYLAACKNPGNAAV